MRRILWFCAVYLCLFCLGSCGIGGSADNARGSDGKVENLSGAGATFPLPFYQLAFKEYAKAGGVQVSYGAIGSGGGIRSLRDRVVDFGATDAFLSDEELADFGEEVLHIPTCMGAVVLAYNLEGVEGLRMTPKIVADMYLGNITKWNDVAIAEVNPGVKLPDMPITLVYRSDGSGTTSVFSHYMASVSDAWASVLGEGKALQWPYGVAAKGNPGVGGILGQTPGAFGYVGSEYAFVMGLPSVALRNAAGRYVQPTPEAIRAAAKVAMPADTRTMITNSPEPDAYPISSLTWIVLYREQNYGGRTQEQAHATQELLAWLLGDEAQALTEAVHYVRLPDPVVALARAQLARCTYGGDTLAGLK